MIPADSWVAGNVLEAMNDIAAIGDRTECVYGEYYAPAFLFRSLGVATKEV
ncbi:MAG: hypothetical protein AB1700_01630 [Bacillota bacterium]